jgi:type IV pilus assembly protein PilB
VELYKKEEEELVQVLSDRYGIPYIDLTVVSIEMEALRLILEKDAREGNIVAFKAVGKKIFVALISPNSDKAKEVVESLERKGFEVAIFMISKASLERALGFYKDISLASESKVGVLDISSTGLEQMVAGIKNVNDVRAMIRQKMEEAGTGHKVSTLLEILVAGALATKASDIHIEPEENDVRIRFRLDGLLNEIYTTSFDVYKLLNSRIKLLSGLKISIKQNSQDGRFSITIGESEIEILTSLMRGSYGESVVMRVIDPNNIIVSYEKLGMEPKLFSILSHAIQKPNGIILNTGPTGSGKTTTLYAILQKVHGEDNKIITIEDPIEYHLAGITQTQVEEETGYTFLQGLRAAMRQDPDVIMVGEIRDTDTAKVAVNSALTGHLVLSTLHTNSAAGAVPRLIELGVNPKILGSALSVVLAQRLVRKICEHCKEEYEPIEPERKIIERILTDMIEEGKGESLEGVDILGYKLWRGRGCEYCHDGYKGRIGIYEALVMSEAMEKVLNQEYPSEREVQKASSEDKIPTLAEDGVIKVLKGYTTLEEIAKAVDLYSDSY